MMSHRQLKGVYLVPRGRFDAIATKAIVPESVYGEELVREGNDTYRIWDPSKSKLGAGIIKGLSQIGIKPGSKVLYLGCASGTTVSHVSDLVGPDGFVYALDFAPRVMRDFMFVVEKRKNILPIMDDANHPEHYKHFVPEVNVVFQDVAQRNQVEIFTKNCEAFLKIGDFGVLALKSRSVDVTKNPNVVFDEVTTQLSKKFVIVDQRKLDPFEKDHMLFVVKKK
ncbi:MAG TPA: fibrillarin-like rRNA/tRNA 2'-O-methyltransferase [Candidatus Nanoarchaeia archaeon]|nr:fibrillarin-like rRNA/tRNA 2'-O-methyltransferase [Candidatus Nanoarchaeia archaeon]